MNLFESINIQVEYLEHILDAYQCFNSLTISIVMSEHITTEEDSYLQNNSKYRYGFICPNTNTRTYRFYAGDISNIIPKPLWIPNFVNNNN